MPRSLSRVLRPTLACAFLAAAFSPALAAAQALTWSGQATVDVSHISAAGASRTTEFDKLDLALDLDLGVATAHLAVHNLSGDLPNAYAGTLQGVNNNEGGRRLRLFEAWVEAPFADGRASILAGLYDLNSEFYVTDASGLLVAPAFGIGSEMAASGPSGPPLFPSTALSLRVAWRPDESRYLMAAVTNAALGVPGDPGGIDTDFDQGVLSVVEGGWTGRGKLALGVWAYSKRLDDLTDTGPLGDPLQSRAQGVYVLAERRLDAGGDLGRAWTAFLRAGVSDGDTGPFDSGWQAGLLVERAWAGRPDSAFSIGVNQGLLGDKYRLAAGPGLSGNETQIELTYADRLTDRITVQPDIMWVINPGGDAAAKTAVVAGVRLTFDFSPLP